MPRSRDSHLERFWRHRLTRYAAAGLSAAEFCSRERVTPSTLYYWRRRARMRRYYVSSGPFQGPGPEHRPPSTLRPLLTRSA